MSDPILFWQFNKPRIGDAFETRSGRWTVVDSHQALGGGYFFMAERES